MVGRKRKQLRIELETHTLQIVPFPLKPGKPIFITPEELEAMRLVDMAGKKQEEAAKVMRCSRTTVSRLLRSGRKKVMQGIIEGRSIFVLK